MPFRPGACGSHDDDHPGGLDVEPDLERLGSLEGAPLRDPLWEMVSADGLLGFVRESHGRASGSVGAGEERTVRQRRLQTARFSLAPPGATTPE